MAGELKWMANTFLKGQAERQKKGVTPPSM